MAESKRALKLHRIAPDATVESLNWSAYAVTGSSFTDAEGSWILQSYFSGLNEKLVMIMCRVPGVAVPPQSGLLVPQKLNKKGAG
jgi:hypothetical protein